jgi:hypothetical protein
MSEKISGKVEKFNQTQGRMPGILVNSVWYNGNLTTQKYVEGLKSKIGASIEIEVNEKKQITFLKILEESRQEQSSPTQKTMIDAYHHSAFVGMAIKVANSRVNGLEASNSLKPSEWAQSVMYHAALIIKEAQEQGILEGKESTTPPEENVYI